MSSFPSKRNPAYVNLVDESGGQLGTASNPLVTTGGGGGTQNVNVTNTVTVKEAPSSTVYVGSANLTATAATLPAQAVNEIIFLQAASSNAENVLIGNATSQPISLSPGEKTPPIQVTNLNLIYAKAATASAVLNYMARS